jgi:ATP-dependent exoDNAse (exonuclease V) beta subunit
LLKANQTRAGLGKVVGTLAHRALEMMEALPADQEERLRYLAGQARALLSEDSEDDEPGDGPRVAGEAAQAAESARTIIERLDQPSHAEIRGLAGQPGAAEVDFALPVGDQWLVTGRFDRLLDNGDVVDWKTDKGDPDQIRNRYRGQMGLYALAVSEARRLRGGPEQTARVSLALLSTGEVIPLDYSPEQITAARAGLESLLNIP